MKKLFFLLIISCLCSDLISQSIECDNPNVKDAFGLAINTVKINTRSGILAAGADYGGEWTRDISINSWNCASLLWPSVAENSMWSVTVNRDTIGHQYWDKIIWAVAALNHYYVTGDSDFLKQAYNCSSNTITELERKAFDSTDGLFKGPAVMADGIAGYPEPVYDRNNYSSYVLDHKNAANIKCLSTNCLYYGAYLSLIEMGSILNEDEGSINDYRKRAEALKESVLRHFYDEKDNKLYYLIDGQGKPYSFQEGLGYSFALIFGILNTQQAVALIKNTNVSDFGITALYPDFPRYSHNHPGRHNNIIWPMINGFFARACIDAGDYASFEKELDGLTSLALDRDKGNYEFREIYNPYAGKPDGGYQAAGREHPDFHWNSCRMQTWSATAYINMVLYGIAGIRADKSGIQFKPYLPSDIHYLKIKDIPYRQAVLSIEIIGSGRQIKNFYLNGRSVPGCAIPSEINGDNCIVIIME